MELPIRRLDPEVTLPSAFTVTSRKPVGPCDHTLAVKAMPNTVASPIPVRK